MSKLVQTCVNFLSVATRGSGCGQEAMRAWSDGRECSPHGRCQSLCMASSWVVEVSDDGLISCDVVT